MPMLVPAVRTGLAAGVAAAVPMAVATFPFGLAYGVGVTAAGIDPWAGAAASWTVLAGAAQLSMLSLIERDASWVVIVAAALVINLRFALYSVALAPAFRPFPARWRVGLPYLMTDQTAALSMRFFGDERDPVVRRWFFLGAGLGIAVVWWVGTIVGLTLGAAIPSSIDIAFTVPLVFVVLVVPTLVDAPALTAAVAGGGVALASAGLPNGLNILAGAAAGVVAGAIVDRWRPV
ncbi:MAG: AzlC family ABC transporter permease [Vicinamibacterales bacterium]